MSDNDFVHSYDRSTGERHHEEVYGGKTHKAKLSHEAVAGAAAFAAFRAYEKKREKEGKKDNHALAKELIAALAAAEAEKLFETKGLDFLDKRKAEKHARDAAEKLYTQHYEDK
ncbi:4478_t:CDS:2 [Ambispora leptoticha]|uniref:4478_t:CDS:1 n=1 Tax=Ambispora leptoticha TaxID=144679 RepID=A0A9N9DDD6_9GLOM|nr:4478_t:CDS:2 [Ambispora leptoticha]